MKKIALFLFSLNGGGSEKVLINLAEGFINNGYQVDIVLVKKEGDYKSQINESIKLIDLDVKRGLLSIFGLIKYLKNNTVDVIIAPWCHLNIMTVIAKIVSRSKCKVILTEHTVSTIDIENSKGFLAKITPKLMKTFYPMADEIVAVSQGVANNLSKLIDVPIKQINVIYNPLISKNFIADSYKEVEDEWFNNLEGKKIISVGRLSKSKDFPTLIKAFKLINEKHLANLIIIGEGEDRELLNRMIEEYGLKDKVFLPGFKDTPQKYLRKCDVFAFPSLWEGLGNVIVEAMATDLPVVCTDCPIGPREILKDGEYGKLVPIGDYVKLAEEIEKVLVSQKEVNYQEALKRFEFKTNINKYIELIERNK